MNKKEEILDAWIMVEHLSEGDINIKDKTIKLFKDLKEGDYYSLFCQEIRKKKFGEHQKGGLVVYFDIFSFGEVVSILQEKYHLKPTNEDIRVGDKFSFALCFDKELNLCSGMTFFTESAYIRYVRDIPPKSIFREYEDNFKMWILQSFDETSEDRDVFNAAMSRVLKKYDIDIQSCRMQVVDNLENNATNLHSFFINDLEMAKLTSADNLTNYLSGNNTGRINLDSKIDSINFNPRAFEKILNPENYPLGRFPSNTKHSLSMMQQVAVNLAIGYDNKQVRSVNGPPGTGKTTLLKDIFAELIVRQAYDIANLPVKHIKGSSENVYYNNASIGEIPHKITKNGIVVASTNNSAVQNIVNELPLIDKIDLNLLEELKSADYFYGTSNSKVSTKWIEEENGRRREELVIEPIPGEDKCWGLFSLEGGKSSNMDNVLANVKHVVWYLENEYITNDKIYEEFKKQYEQVSNVRTQMQTYAIDTKEYEDCCSKLNKLQESYKVEREQKESLVNVELKGYEEMVAIYHSDKIHLEKQLSDIVNRKETIDKNRNSVELYLQLLQEQKPRFFAPRNEKASYKNKLREYGQQLLMYIDESRENDDNERRTNNQIQELNNRITELICKKQKKQQVLENWITEKEAELSKLENRLVEYEKRLNGRVINKLDMGMPYEELQMSNPWFDEEYRIAQSKLFIMALKVRKQFLYDNRKNLKASIIIWSKQNDYLSRKHMILAAWNWLNMTIPVISSTFASFSSMCKHLDAKTLGHLFIDEAGQALPQASVGAIYRSEYVMAVGDPSQIKPVLTLDSNVLGMLREHFNVSEKYLSASTSTQTLVDAISQYGFDNEQTVSADSWRGIPLWVHRRCKYPMFSISNKISYQGLMVQGEEAYGKAEWFDIRGKADNKYVKEQGEFLVQKLQEMIEKNPKIIDKSEEDIVYVITPFSNVAYHLSQELRKIHFTRYDEHYKPTNVGTIHTFQGKEAPIVFLVLGADSASGGAAKWAVDEPNMMNVAATRAKEEFYIIGDKTLYLNLKCDVATDTYQIIDQYKKQYSEFGGNN